MRGRDGRPTDSASVIAARQLAEEADARRIPTGFHRRRRPPVVPRPVLPPPAEPDPDPEPDRDPWS